LIGAGTAICGTSAIVTVASSLQAEDEEITMSAATVNLLGLALMFTLPVLGGLLHMKENAVGIWAGSSIQAVPQAVAAGFAFGPEAGSVATLVKLLRVALLVPYSILIAFLYGTRSQFGSGGFFVRAWRTVPGFLWGFVALAVLASANLVPTLQFSPTWLPAGQSYSVTLRALLLQASNILLAFVMAALGLEVGLKSIARVGRPAMLTGFAAMCAVTALSWALITLLI
jgi:Predicted membrane protein